MLLYPYSILKSVSFSGFLPLKIMVMPITEIFCNAKLNHLRLDYVVTVFIDLTRI